MPVGIHLVEKQLRVLLGSRVPSDAKTLGGVLYTISNNGISPYNQYLTDLYSVNRLRKSGAHTGNLRKSDVDTIRKGYWRIFNSPILERTFTNQYLKSKGFITLSERYLQVS